MKVIELIAQNMKMLKNIESWLDKATQHAEAKKFEVDTLVQARLAPDQYPLARQIQSSCDTAKFAAAYLAATEPPKHPDTETTIAELRTRIRSTLSFLESIDKSKLEGADERKVAPAFLKGKWMRGDEYMAHMSLPNFYFHVTTTYSILRHNGVDLGKQDFIGHVALHD